jgi:hypothetical protein
MRKFLGIFVAVLMVAGLALAALDAYDSMTYKTVLAPTVAVLNTAQTNSYVDIVGRKGIGTAVLAVGPASTNAANFGCNLVLEHCATTNGTYATVTNLSAAVGTVTAFKLDMQALNRYLRTKVTSTNDACVVSAVVVYPK